MQFAEVVLPYSFGKQISFLSYAVPSTLESKLKVGHMVYVPLQNRKVIGLVWRIHSEEPNFKNIKEVSRLAFEYPVVTPWQIETAKWIADYYYAALSKVLKLWIPKELWQGKDRFPTHDMTYLLDESPICPPDSKPNAKQKKQQEFLDDLKNGPVSFLTLKRKWGLRKQKWFQELKDEKRIELRNEDIIPLKTDLSETEAHLKALNEHQQRIVGTIQGRQGESKPFLLHGITGSGKTEVYLHLALEQIKQGKSVVMLVPEISLTPQMEAYFSRVFGDELAVIHSRLSRKERVEEWYSILKGYKKMIIGSRSALFSPIQDLGLIIVDEEHEWTYKQDKEPRYHVRETVQKMQQETDCMVVFGSATPNIESYHKAHDGGFILLELEERAGESAPTLPEVSIVDLRDEFQKKNYSIFSTALKNKMKETLEKKQQIILFLNKRGAHSAVICRDCGHVCKCPLCETTMAHHQDFRSGTSKLLCHYCGSIQLPPGVCPHCKSAHIRYVGTGTQKVEAEVKELFPDARVFRADRDTTGKKEDFQKLYKALQSGEIDILVGTQMIAKGFDIPNVTLVGVILADTTLYIPDFRSSERLFQLLTQVAGRAGRGEEPGEVVIQTYSPDHPALQAAREHDFRKFYEVEAKDREELEFPPYQKIIKLSFTHPNKAECMNEIHALRDRLREYRDRLQEKNHDFHCHIFTAPALIPRLHNKYHFHIVLKGMNPDELLRGIELPTGFRVDVDPVQLC